MPKWKPVESEGTVPLDKKHADTVLDILWRNIPSTLGQDEKRVIVLNIIDELRKEIKGPSVTEEVMRELFRKITRT